MPENAPDFAAVLKALAEAHVRIVLIGEWAMMSHGSAHVTQDIDLGYAAEPANVQALASALAPFHPRLRGVPDDVPFTLDARTFRNTQNLTLETDMGAIDLLGHIAGVDTFDGLWQRADELELFGQTVRVASLDDLIAMKRTANRPKDQAHVMELLALKRLTEQA